MLHEYILYVNNIRSGFSVDWSVCFRSDESQESVGSRWASSVIAGLFFLCSKKKNAAHFMDLNILTAVLTSYKNNEKFDGVTFRSWCLVG